MNEMNLHETYLGLVGQPVPTASPEELKRVLESREIEAAWTGQAAIGLDAFESFCGLLTNRNAVCYRAMLLRVLRHLARPCR